MNWQPIATRPQEGEILATLRVYSNSTKAFSHWDTHVLLVQDDGALAEDHGWALEDYRILVPDTEISAS
jgi:hypothetical protein